MKPWVFVFPAKLIFILDFRIFGWSLATKIASKMAPTPTPQRWRTQMHPRSAWRFNADVGLQLIPTDAMKKSNGQPSCKPYPAW